ncbi:unnamed protein product [Closterium sp. NIES-54]
MCSRTSCHLATFTRRPGPSLYALTIASAQVVESGHVGASIQVSASGQLAASCSCRILSHQTLLWHQRLGHPSLPRLRNMHSRLLVSGLPRSLPSLPRPPALPCLPCVEGRQRAAPHSSEFPPTIAPLQTLHMDVWGPALVGGTDQERHFLLVVDDYTRYITVFPLRRKADVSDLLIPWIRAARRQLRERFWQDLPVLRLHSDKGGGFSFDLLEEFCRDEGIRQTFMLPASPEQNGIAERRIGLIMEVAPTSMIHAAAPHFLWPFAVQYAAPQLNLWPRVSLPETSATLRWTGEFGDASAFWVWGALSLVRNTTASKLSPRTLRCAFLGFPTDDPPWQFYYPRERHVFSSQDVTFDESAYFYRLHPDASHPVPLAPLFLPGAVDSGAENAGAEHGGAETEGEGSRGAATGGAGSGGAGTGGADSGRAASPSGGVAVGDPAGGTTGGSAGVGGTGATAGARGARAASAGGAAGAGVASARGAAGAGGTGGTAGGAGVASAGGAARAGGAGAASTRGAAGARGAGAASAGGAAGVGGTGVAAGAGGAGPACALHHLLGLQPTPTEFPVASTTPPLLFPPADLSQPQLLPHFPLPSPAPYVAVTESLIERRKPETRASFPERREPKTRASVPARVRRVRCSPSSVPQRVVLSSPLASSLPVVADSPSNLARASSPAVTRFLPTVVTDPTFSSPTASTLVAELVDFAAVYRLDYLASLLECLAVAAPHLATMLLAPEVDPDALNIPTPRSYREAILGEYSSQWQTAVDAEMASWKCTGTYLDEVPPHGAKIVSGMWIFRVKRLPGSLPAFKACYVAQGFSQRVGVDFFHTFSPTPKMTTLRVLLHVATRPVEVSGARTCAPQLLRI